MGALLLLVCHPVSFVFVCEVTANSPLSLPPSLPLSLSLSLSVSLCSYNAMKYTLQDGNINHPLPAISHLMCAMAAGMYNMSPPPHSPHTLTPSPLSHTPHSHTLSPGALTLVVTNPVWVIKTRMCLVSSSSVPRHMQYSSLRDGLVNLWRYEGVRGFYSVSFTHTYTRARARAHTHTHTHTHTHRGSYSPPSLSLTLIHRGSYQV